MHVFELSLITTQTTPIFIRTIKRLMSRASLRSVIIFVVVEVIPQYLAVMNMDDVSTFGPSRQRWPWMRIPTEEVVYRYL